AVSHDHRSWAAVRSAHSGVRPLGPCLLWPAAPPPGAHRRETGRPHGLPARARLGGSHAGRRRHLHRRRGGRRGLPRDVAAVRGQGLELAEVEVLHRGLIMNGRTQVISWATVTAAVALVATHGSAFLEALAGLPALISAWSTQMPFGAASFLLSLGVSAGAGAFAPRWLPDCANDAGRHSIG